MTPIVLKLFPRFKNLDDALEDALEDSLLNKLNDKLFYNFIGHQMTQI